MKSVYGKLLAGIIFILVFSTTVVYAGNNSQVVMPQALDLSVNPCNSVHVKLMPGELVIRVSPNGVDDTGNIQCALDWAVDTGMPVVKLSAGDFFISSIQVEKFNGSLQGFTTDSTIIEVLDDSVNCHAIAQSGRVPAAIKFIKGEPRLRFMTIHAHRACTTNSRFFTLVHFTGDAVTPNACTNDVVFGAVDRVVLDGTARATGPHWGVLVGTESEHFDACEGRLLGSFKLNRSILANTMFGVASGLKAGAQVDINFNSFVNQLVGIRLIDSNQNTTITRNEFYGEDTADEPYFGVQIISTDDAPSATRVVVNKNDFNLSSDFGRISVGVLAQQPGKVVNISNIVTDNRFVMRGDTTWGVYATDVSNSHVSANRFTGTAHGAVIVAGTEPAKGWTITANTGFNDLVPNSLRHIWLRENTRQCIVGPGQGATVNNFGVGNTVLSSYSPSPLVDGETPRAEVLQDQYTGEISAEVSSYLKKMIEAEKWDGNVISGPETRGKDSSALVTQSTESVKVKPQAIQNPCDDTYVKQAPNELVIKVTPTGVDDTENIQCALLWAVDTGMPVVKLSADTFYISGLQVRNFNGSLQGITTDSTTLVIRDRSVACIGMGVSGQIPAAIKFIKGEPRLRYMTIKAHRACINDIQLDVIVHFTGEPADLPDCASDVIFGVVDRVIVEGTEEFIGPDIAIKVGAESDYFHGGCQRNLLGTFKLNRSTLKNTQTGISTSMKSAAQVDINFNTFTGTRYSINMYNHNQNTTITGNDFVGDAREGYSAVPGLVDGYIGIQYGNGVDGPKTTRAVIHNNDFNIFALPGLESSGLWILGAKGTRVSSLVTNNRFTLTGGSTWGIRTYSAANANTHVSTNSFMGNAAGAIQVAPDDPVTGWTITANKGLGSFVSGSTGDISLGAKTSRFIIGPGQDASVSNLGTNNTILSSDTSSPLVKVKTD